jgi:hypothetical protein
MSGKFMSANSKVPIIKNTRPPAKHFKSLRALVIALVVVLLLPGATRATVVVRLNILELTLNSTKIIEGTVTSIRGINVPRGGVCTEITMAVSETLRGKHRDKAVFIIPGGSLDGKKFLVTDGVPTFKIGESAVVFLSGTNDRIVVGFSQGKFSEETVGGEKYAVQNTNGICLLDAKGPMGKESGGAVTDWEKKFTSKAIRKTSQIKAGETTNLYGSSNETGLIKGGYLKVPMDLFKNTVKECNPENYTASGSDLSEGAAK